jgi:hypothetical protein
MNTVSQDNIPNHLVWAILATLFCCLPLGIVSIIYAAKVDGLRLAGDLAGAREMSHKAKMWAIWSALSGPILLAIWFVFLGGLAGLGALSGNY